MKVLSIDIGIINMGYVFAELTFEISSTNLIKNDNYTFNDNIKIIECNRVNITKMKHNLVKYCDCKLEHDNCIPDYLDHFIQENNLIFEEADNIIIERQPPLGITNVQDLIFTKFRKKVSLISPNSIHKYFNMSKEYDIRKKQSENISLEYLKDFNNFSNNIRKHDISDAMLMLLYYYKINTDILIKNNKCKKSLIDNLEMFRYFPE